MENENRAHIYKLKLRQCNRKLGLISRVSYYLNKAFPEFLTLCLRWLGWLCWAAAVLEAFMLLQISDSCSSLETPEISLYSALGPRWVLAPFSFSEISLSPPQNSLFPQDCPSPQPSPVVPS